MTKDEAKKVAMMFEDLEGVVKATQKLVRVLKRAKEMQERMKKLVKSVARVSGSAVAEQLFLASFFDKLIEASEDFATAVSISTEETKPEETRREGSRGYVPARQEVCESKTKTTVMAPDGRMWESFTDFAVGKDETVVVARKTEPKKRDDYKILYRGKK